MPPWSRPGLEEVAGHEEERDGDRATADATRLNAFGSVVAALAVAPGGAFLSALSPRRGQAPNPEFQTPGSSLLALNDSIRLRAFAKINLGLKILGKSSDGYHEIRTVYQTVALHDRLEISLQRSGKRVLVDCDDPEIPSGEDNLVYRACELWRAARRFGGGIRVRLEKQIPAGSGLGGGSSDAAVTILGLERLTGDGLGPGSRFELAARLGSDVPLFLWGGRVLGCARGQEVYPLQDLPPRRCLVVFPGFAVSTAEAYREADLRLTKKPSRPSMKRFGAWSRFFPDDWGPAENDFERIVFARWPELARLKAQLIRAGAEIASLTGSGSALFALFASARQLAQASKLVPRAWQAFRTRTLRRIEYQRKLIVNR